jgi:cytochrome c oxidase assembly factor CtaG
VNAAVWLVLAVVVTPYLVGVRRLWHAAGTGHGIARWRALSFAAASGILIAAFCQPFDAVSDARFSMHMTQHILLVAVVPPLLILGKPGAALAWAVRGVVWRVDRIPMALRRAWLGVTTPLVAWLAHSATLWLWHLPRWYQLALQHPAVHAGEHVTLLGTALLLWHCAMHPRSGRRAGAGIAVLLMLATAMQSGALGALLAGSTRVWYPMQEGLRGTAAALADQQLAGLLMWVPAGLIYAIAGCVFFRNWIRGPVAAAPQMMPSEVPG